MFDLEKARSLLEKENYTCVICRGDDVITDHRRGIRPLMELLETAEPEKYLRPVDTMFRNYPAITLTAKQEIRCRNGNSFSVTMDPGIYRAYSQNGEFLMLAKVEDGTMSTVKSFFEV